MFAHQLVSGSAIVGDLASIGITLAGMPSISRIRWLATGSS